MGATGLEIHMERHSGEARDGIYMVLFLHVSTNDRNSDGRRSTFDNLKNQWRACVQGKDGGGW